MGTGSDLQASLEARYSNHGISSKSPRYPTPIVDHRINQWIRSVAAADMSTRSEAPSDENSLGESAYEFIDTDEESRDGNATESVASTDFGRPDDVASLADTEQSGEDSGEEDNPEVPPTPPFASFDHAVENAFNTPTIGQSTAMILEDIERPLTQSIEFEEPYSLDAETISVKHTVADFNEEQTANTVQGMRLSTPPERLVITIRQTMTKQGLSTRDPLRLLYVGSHSAKQDIIHKIASSVTASVETDKRAQHLRHSPQLYNVVPVSAFGSERTPEIELMHSSGYQINVEDCTAAQSLKFEDVPEKPDVIKLTLDDNFSCHSVPEGDHFIVEPPWELPHVALFYCSDNDDIRARRTMSTARKFMSRHGVPSIVISHKQLFDRGQCMSLDQHSIHMCLESRDPTGRGNIIHRRLPIDLASFLNIDARQMNRNLAYLTGLHEPQELPTTASNLKKIGDSLVNSQDLEKTSYNSINDSVSFIRNRNGAEWRALMPVALLLLSVFAAVLTGVPSYRFSTAPAISINSKVMSTIPISTSSSVSSSLTASITSGALAASTATRTITVTHAQSLSPNSLALKSSMDLANLAAVTQNKPANTSFVCSAEVLGDREVLIRIPSATKLSWLTKEAMSVNITRDNVTVDTERVYSSNEGIVLLLAKTQAYGLLNISIITTKKPRINETFQMDFGTTASKTWQSLFGKLSSLVPENARTFAEPITYEHIRTITQKMVEDAKLHSQFTFVQIEEARRRATEQATLAGARLSDLAKSISLATAEKRVKVSTEFGAHLSNVESKILKKLHSWDQLREPLNSGLMKAQVQSKLLWLNIQGKNAEYEDYKKRAAEASRVGAATSKKSRDVCTGSNKKSSQAATRRAARAGRKAGRKLRT